MRMTTEFRAQLPALYACLALIPDNQFFQLGVDDEVMFQASTQAEVRAIRACYPGVVWKKEFTEGGCNWWEYRTTYNGINLRIYAVKEAPPTCHAIEEEKWVEED